MSRAQTCHSTDPDLHSSLATRAPTNRTQRAIAIKTSNFSRTSIPMTHGSHRSQPRGYPHRAPSRYGLTGPIVQNSPCFIRTTMLRRRHWPGRSALSKPYRLSSFFRGSLNERRCVWAPPLWVTTSRHQSDDRIGSLRARSRKVTVTRVMDTLREGRGDWRCTLRR